jgi:hypothetical protein
VAVMFSVGGRVLAEDLTTRASSAVRTQHPTKLTCRLASTEMPERHVFKREEGRGSVCNQDGRVHPCWPAVCSLQ